MNRLLLLALPALLAGCSAPHANSAAPASPAGPATPAAPSTPVAPAASTAPVAADAAAAPVATTPPAMQALALALYRNVWQLKDAKDAKGVRVKALFARASKPVELSFEDKQVAIGNACNQMSGPYALGVDTITVGPFAATRKACTDPKLMGLDSELGRQLQGPLKAALVAGGKPKLRLTTASGDILEFIGKPAAERRYQGPAKRLTLEVAADTRPCRNLLNPRTVCLQVRDVQYDDQGHRTGTPGAYKNFFGTIEGYIHEPGVRNILRVDRYARKQMPNSAARHAYVLDTVIESVSEPG